MSLDEWVRNGWLKNHKPDKAGIRYLLDTVKDDFNNCLNKDLSLDWQFKIAYSSIRNCALTALEADGYRPSGESHHYWTIQSLAYTLKIDANIVELIDDFRTKRNRSAYERSGMITDREVKEIIELSKSIQSTLFKWLKSNHSELL